MNGLVGGVGGKGNVIFWATMMDMAHFEDTDINRRVTTKLILREIGW
jgi:hypothetical protein